MNDGNETPDHEDQQRSTRTVGQSHGRLQNLVLNNLQSELIHDVAKQNEESLILDFKFGCSPSTDSDSNSNSGCPFPNKYFRFFDQDIQRKSIIEKIWFIFDKLHYHLQSYYAAIQYLDTYLSSNHVADHESTELCFAVAGLAVKVHEKRENIFKFHNFMANNSPAQFQISKFQTIELLILRTMNFKLIVKTPYLLLVDLIHKRQVLSSIKDPRTVRNQNASDDNKINEFSFFLIELIAMHYEFNQYNGDVIAITCYIMSKVCLGTMKLNECPGLLGDKNLKQAIKCCNRIMNHIQTEFVRLYGLFSNAMKSLIYFLQARLIFSRLSATQNLKSRCLKQHSPFESKGLEEGKRPSCECSKTRKESSFFDDDPNHDVNKFDDRLSAISNQE